MQQLRDAVAEGRIDLEELDSRLELALRAKTHGDLAALTEDLPKPPPPPKAQELLVLEGGMTGEARGPGPWEVPAHIVAHGGMAGVKVDFTGAHCPHSEVNVAVYGEMAGVTVVIPDGWVVDTTQVRSGMGGLKNKTTPDRDPGTPLVRLSGEGGIAGVAVRHPNRWERRKQRTNNPPLP